MKYFIGTTFYSALIFKKAPGTLSSLCVFFALLLLPPLPFALKFLLVGMTIILHVISFPFFVQKFNSDDVPVYTLDETLAMLLLNIFFFTPTLWTAALILFRFYDIVKPFGIKRVERSASLPASVRNVGDDILAAIYTFLTITVLDYVF